MRIFRHSRSPSPFSALYVTLDSHHKYDIAHPGYWKVAETGEPPAPFTLITDEDVRAGKYIPSNVSNLAWAQSYTTSLAAKGSFILCIWPEHCLMGSAGHNVHPNIYAG